MKQYSDDGTGQVTQAPYSFPAFLDHPYFRTVWESTTDAMALSDAEGIVFAANAAYLDLYGFPAEAVLGHSFAIIFPEATRQQAIQNYKTVFTRGDTEPLVADRRQDAEGHPYFATTIRRTDGALRMVESRVEFIDDGGRRVAMLSIIRDVTARRQAQESLEVALDAADMGIWDLDLKTSKTRTNLRHNQIYGYSEPLIEWGPDILRQHVLPEDLAMLEAAFAQAMALGESTLEVRVCRLDGQVRWIYAQGRVYYDEAGRPTRIAGVTQDITERKQAAERLRASEERFRRYFELGLIGMAISSPTKGLVEVNDELCRIFGYTRDELLHMTWAELTHPDDLASNVAPFNQVMAGEIDGYVLDKRCIRKDGQVIDTTLSMQCVRRSDGAVDYIVALVQDITERKRAEESQAHLLRKVEKQRMLLRRLNQTLAQMQERERQELAHNLHDLVGQNLTALNLSLKLIQTRLATRLPTDNPVDASLADARKLVEQVTVQARDVMSDLRPPMLNDYGLLAALRWYATQVARRTGLSVKVQGEQAFPRLPEEMELHLFRIAQEACNNASKHAQATRISVTLAAADLLIRMTVADNGHGMALADPTASAPPQGWGLLIMRERAEIIGGRFEMHSGPGKGTTITVEVDL
jgi:PAS domain S-box-containing protein